MSTAKHLNGDVISGAVLAALGTYILSTAWGWNYMSEEGPGPGFFPVWYGIAMVVLSLLLVVRSAVNPKASEKTDWKGIRRALMSWLAFAIAVVLLKPLGFLISFALLTLFVVSVMYGRPFKTALAAAVGNAVGFYLLFVLALDISLPVGLLGF